MQYIKLGGGLVLRKPFTNRECKVAEHKKVSLVPDVPVGWNEIGTQYNQG